MRLGIVSDPTSWERLCRDVATARGTGLDLVWLPADGAACAPLAAAALASRAHGLNVVVEVQAGTHPIGLAEELAVADQALGGRVTGVLRGEDPGLVEETLAVLRAALSGRPFRHRGERWTLPAAPEQRVRVTPSPAQLRLPLWLRGAGLERLDAVLVDEGSAPPSAGLGPALRPCPTTPAGLVDVPACVELLRWARDERGVDVAAMTLDPGLDSDQRSEAIRRLGDRVRPQLQHDGLPPELIASWDEDPPERRAR